MSKTPIKSIKWRERRLEVFFENPGDKFSDFERYALFVDGKRFFGYRKFKTDRNVFDANLLIDRYIMEKTLKVQ